MQRDNHFRQCNGLQDSGFAKPMIIQQFRELQKYLRAHEFGTVVRSDLYKALQEVNNFKLPRIFHCVFYNLDKAHVDYIFNLFNLCMSNATEI